MAKLYDLSVTLRPDHLENSELKLDPVSHEEAARVFAKRHGIKVSDLPDASLFASERIELRSHLGTHLDAPFHFYPTSEGRPAKFIDEWPLDWCMGDAIVLDFRHKKPSEHITEHDVAAALEKIGRSPKPGDIAMLWTGGTDGYDEDPKFAGAAAGLNAAALDYVFRLGVKVMSTDSATIDMPIALMTERFVKGDKASYFPIHRAGRWKEWTHAEKLAHMETLPGASGFKVMFFPVKIARGTGAWIRAVAIQDDWLDRPVQLVDLSLPIMNHSFEPEESRILTIGHEQNQRIKAKRLRMPVSEIVHLGSMDIVDTYTHAGTHIDAPYHFGPDRNGQKSRTADELPLEWFYADGVLLDFSTSKRPGERISPTELTEKLEQIGYRLKQDDIVLIRTGAGDRFGDDPNFADLSVSVDPKAFLWLLDQGIRVIGCDSESLDGPVGPMVEALRAGRKERLYPIHYAGRDREFCLIAKMDLGSLPRAHGFKVAAFPIKIEGCSAAWTRAVALAERKA